MTEPLRPPAGPRPVCRVLGCDNLRVHSELTAWCAEHIDSSPLMAAAHGAVDPGDGIHGGSSDGGTSFAGSHEPPAALAASPEGLDAAWAEAEAALPEGWIGPEVAPYPDTPDRFYAMAFSRRHWEGEEDNLVDGEGPSPTAALRALAARLTGARP